MPPTEEKKDIRKRHFAFIDLEMTGLDLEKHEITEIGLVLARYTVEKSGYAKMKKIGEYEWKIMPDHLETADPVSLKIAHFEPEIWKEEAMAKKKALTELVTLCKDATMVGHNVAFDFSFLEKALCKNRIENTMHYHKLDTISIAFALLHKNATLVKFSLSELCKYFEIKNEKSHTALSDARATFELFQKLICESNHICEK